MPEDKQKNAHKKVIIVMPAYNAELTIEKTVNDIPKGVADEIILVDDGSRDRTVEIAKRLGLTVIVREKNGGYGANQKTCYMEALVRGADIIVMLHPDYQYDARIIPYAIGFLTLGICDIVVGSRIRTRKEALDGGMPLYKYLANRMLTLIENVISGQSLGDFHSGFRIYTREVLEVVPFERNSDDFAFDSQFLFQAIYFGFRLGDVPIPAKYFKEASSINFSRAITYGFATLGIMLAFVGSKLGILHVALFKEKKSRRV